MSRNQINNRRKRNILKLLRLFLIRVFMINGIHNRICVSMHNTRMDFSTNASIANDTAYFQLFINNKNHDKR